ncbi:hypothetical protein E4U55_000959 [Claviceps digitariae]|nr:hypothetical protein E4U55_000959 [Claviceps digitariae]
MSWFKEAVSWVAPMRRRSQGPASQSASQQSQPRGGEAATRDEMEEMRARRLMQQTPQLQPAQRRPPDVTARGRK